MQRIELRFFLLAYTVPVVTFLVGRVVQSFTASQGLDPYTTLRVVGFVLVIAYGITSQGILNVRATMRFALSYVLLGAYAGLVFTGVWLATGFAQRALGYHGEFGQALVAGLAVTLLVNATGTPVKRLALKILPAPEVDFEAISAAMDEVFQEVTTIEGLVEGFTRVLRRRVATPQVRVYLADEQGFYEQTAEDIEDPATAPRLPADGLVFQELARGAPDVTPEDLLRRAPGAHRDALLEHLGSLKVNLALPVREHDKLAGVLLLGARASGRMYGIAGRRVLRLVAQQFGVAAANARLYTEARQSQAYNEFLVEHLSCGVIATNRAGQLTVVNPEALRLLQAEAPAAPARFDLAPDLARLIPPALRGGSAVEGQEIILRPETRERTVLRVDCLPFFSERRRLLGALLVLDDHTAVESLQRQLRQADRLATLGTIAAGLAHEIKNPLTAIKTFLQLLPARYEDEEFRCGFSALAVGEIGRIERILGQMLNFTRSGAPQWTLLSLNEVVDGIVRLLAPQASKLGVTVRQSLRADPDRLVGDRDRLQQVVLNLLLNAIQASPQTGQVEVVTGREPELAGHDALFRLDVRDEGGGIPAERLPHIFDPFFTTKNEGTGLGLSVSYNIVAEHGGRLNVRTEVGRGTCFSVDLPAIPPAAAAAGLPTPAPA